MTFTDTKLTEGSIAKKLLVFSVPMILGNLLQQVYNLVDTMICGRYIGADALAAVGSVYTLMTFLTSIIIGLCMGSGAFFSVDYGANKQDALCEDIKLSFVFIGVVSLVLGIIVYPLTDPILTILQTPSEILDFTKEYVQIIFAGILFTFLYNFFAYLLRAIGNSVIPLIFLGVSAVLNIGLDLWFVVGLKQGVSGAALATVISQAVAGLGLSFYVIRKFPNLLKNTKNLRINKIRLKEIIINDVSTGIQQSIMNFGILMIQGLVNSFGTIIMAAFTAAVKIDTIAYMPAQEFGNAYSLFVSQNYGAKKYDRIKQGMKISFILSILFCQIVSLLIFLSANNLMGIFVDSSEIDIIMQGAKYLRIEGAFYAGIGVLFLWYGYFRGINKPQISLVLTIVSLGTRVLLSYTLAPNSALGVVAIWLSIPIGWLLADVFGIIFYKKSNRISPL